MRMPQYAGNKNAKYIDKQSYQLQPHWAAVALCRSQKPNKMQSRFTSMAPRSHRAHPPPTATLSRFSKWTNKLNPRHIWAQHRRPLGKHG